MKRILFIIMTVCILFILLFHLQIDQTTKWNVQIPPSEYQIYKQNNKKIKYKILKINKDYEARYFSSFQYKQDQTIEIFFIKNIKQLDIDKQYLQNFNDQYCYKVIRKNNQYLLLLYFIELGNLYSLEVN